MTEIEVFDTSETATRSPHKTFAVPAEFVLLDAERRKSAVRRRHHGVLHRATTRRRIASAVAVGALVVVGASVADAAIQRTVMHSASISTSASASSAAQSLVTASAKFAQLNAQLNADSRALTQLENATRATLVALSVSGAAVPSVRGAAASASTSPALALPTFASSAPAVAAPVTHATTGASSGG